MGGCSSSKSDPPKDRNNIQQPPSARNNDTIEKQQVNNITIGYWAFPGLGQPIRYLLELTDTPYNDEVYSRQDTSQWYSKDKQVLKLPFPNLPYLLAKTSQNPQKSENNSQISSEPFSFYDFRISESVNITNYLLSEPEFLSSNHREQYSGRSSNAYYQVKIIQKICARVISRIYAVIQQKSLDNRVLKFIDDIQPIIKQLQEALNGNTTFFKELTLADICFYTAMTLIRLHLPEMMQIHENEPISSLTTSAQAMQLENQRDIDKKNQFNSKSYAETLIAALQAFEANPRIKAYHESKRYQRINPNFTPIHVDPISIGYWNRTGLVQPARYVLELARRSYTDTLYQESISARQNDKEEQLSGQFESEEKEKVPANILKQWDIDEKKKLGFHELSELPYAYSVGKEVNDTIRINGSINLVEFVIRATNSLQLLGTPRNKYAVRQIWMVCCDLLVKIEKLRLMPSEEQSWFTVSKILPVLAELGKKLDKKPLFFNTQLTIADIYMYHVATYLERVQPNEHGFQYDFKELTKHFEGNSIILSYHASAAYKSLEI